MGAPRKIIPRAIAWPKKSVWENIMAHLETVGRRNGILRSQRTVTNTLRREELLCARKQLLLQKYFLKLSISKKICGQKFKYLATTSIKRMRDWPGQTYKKRRVCSYLDVFARDSKSSICGRPWRLCYIRSFTSLLQLRFSCSE